MVCEASDHKLKVCTKWYCNVQDQAAIPMLCLPKLPYSAFCNREPNNSFPMQSIIPACLTRSVSIAFFLLFPPTGQCRMYFIWAMDSNVPSPRPAFPYVHLQNSNLPSSWSALHTKYPHIWSSNLRLCITSQTRWVAKNTITVVRQAAVFLLAYGHLVRRHCPEGGECRIASRRTKYE
jgi:hypothetical protein